jgi:hypothetical protein
MEESAIIETLKPSLLSNIWVERRFIIYMMVAAIIGIYALANLFKFFEAMLGIFAFVGIVFFGFVAIVAHVRYYFYYERNRKVELYHDRMIIKLKNEEIQQILKSDIIKIILYDKRHIDEGNFFPTILDSFYYLIIISKNQERVILTCLLDIKLKKKINIWYGQELKHSYQFFPFPLFGDLSEI